MSEAAASWAKAWDAYLELLGQAAESTLQSAEFLRLQRRTLDLMCGHRDLWQKLGRELAASPAARPALKAAGRGRKR